MERRKFLTASLAASTLAMAGDVAAQPAKQNGRQFYQLRRYRMVNGPEVKLTEDFFREALIPAAGRMGLGPVGAFRLEVGQGAPTYYLLIPGSSIETLAELDLLLAKDAKFLKAAAPYWNATATAPAFERLEISLLAAFSNWPKITPPSADKTKRVYQLRTYASPSIGEHVLKVKMFHAGELDIFLKSGFHPIFFGDALTGSHLPHLTYMLSFKNMAELEAKWKIFSHDPAWKKLEHGRRFGFDQIVSNINNLILSALDCSQI